MVEMLACLICIISLLLHSTTVSSQLVTRYLSFRDDPNSLLRCWGDIDEYRYLLGVPAGATLAKVCRLGAFMECGYTRDPNRPYFGNVGYHAHEEINPSDLLNPPFRGQIGHTQTEHFVLEICSIKCACLRQSATAPISRYHDEPANSTYLLEFDSHGASEVHRGTPREPPNAHYIYGLELPPNPYRNQRVRGGVPWYRNAPMLYDTFYRPPGDTTSNIDSFAYIGSPDNKPICTTENDVREELGPDVSELLYRSLRQDEKLDSTSLCAHQFYGGRSKGNLGAVCRFPRRGSATQRVLRIDDIWKAPQYTNDYYSPRLYQMLFVKAIETYCLASCHCQGEEDSVIAGRVQSWQRMNRGIQQKGSKLNQEIIFEKSVISQSGDFSNASPPGATDGGEVGNDSSSGTGNEVASSSLRTGCTSNSDCCADCVCIVKLKDTVGQVQLGTGNFILGCVARSTINPHPDKMQIGSRGKQIVGEQSKLR